MHRIIAAMLLSSYRCRRKMYFGLGSLIATPGRCKRSTGAARRGGGYMLDPIEERAFVATGSGPLAVGQQWRRCYASSWCRSISRRRCRSATLKPRSPFLSIRGWWRRQATRSPCYALVMEFMRNPLSWFLVHPVAQAKVTDVPRPIQEPHNRAPPDRPPIINMQRNDYRL
jgi:hypothetical protein